MINASAQRVNSGGGMQTECGETNAVPLRSPLLWPRGQILGVWTPGHSAYERSILESGSYLHLLAGLIPQLYDTPGFISW